MGYRSFFAGGNKKINSARDSAPRETGPREIGGKKNTRGFSFARNNHCPSLFRGAGGEEGGEKGGNVKTRRV